MIHITSLKFYLKNITLIQKLEAQIRGTL
jgi:hypothetical protein